jgi:hypothetical protein
MVLPDKKLSEPNLQSLFVGTSEQLHLFYILITVTKGSNLFVRKQKKTYIRGLIERWRVVYEEQVTQNPGPESCFPAGCSDVIR